MRHARVERCGAEVKVKDLDARLKRYALSAVRLYDGLPRQTAAAVLGWQFLLGYACWLRVPFEIEPMMRVLLWLLPKSRQPLMRELMVHVVGEVGVPAQPEGRG